jgi:BatD DUF11 like domain
MRRPLASSRSIRAAGLALAVAALVVLLPDAQAHADPSFVIELDREAAAPGEPFVCQVTLTVAGEEVDGYRAPEFKGLRIVSTPQYPSRSTQMSIGGGQTIVQNAYSWTYQLMVPPGAKGPFVIGAAHARLGGKELRSNSVNVRVGASAGGRPSAAQRRPSPFDLFGGGAEPEQPSSEGGSFIRVVPDKTHVYVGEPVVVTWSLCTNQHPGKFDPTTEAHTDGFWSEDLPSTNPKGRFVFNDETINGRPYQVATIMQKVLFPLRDGKLAITPLEADIAQVDFFGTALRGQHLKADPLTIEALPLPRADQPAGFEVGNVGRYTLAMRADRTTVSVGEAVTVTVEIKGVGNVRNVQPPALATPAGWKAYPPKETVTLDGQAAANNGAGVGGTKTVEVLLLPEHAGTVMIPSLELPTFDPEAKRYVTLKSEPLRLDVAGDATAAVPHAPGVAAGGPAVENVIGAAIRPIRARSRLTRDVGTTFLRSSAFGWLLFFPPFALGLTVLVERVRGRLASDTQRTQQRRMRRMVRKHLAAAEGHREAGRATELYIEIERVLREVLAARLGRSVAGLRRDELSELLAARGLPAETTARLLAELEACDQARFAPGGDTAGASALAAALERADDLIGVIEKAPLRQGGAS